MKFVVNFVYAVGLVFLIFLALTILIGVFVIPYIIITGESPSTLAVNLWCGFLCCIGLAWLMTDVDDY